MAKAADRGSRRSAGATRGQSGPPPSLQVGALCWRLTRKGALRVLLITSRDTGRWVIPKGWPMRNRTEAEAAAREAWEEAGVRGEVSPWHLGLYGYPKIMPKGRPVPCVVRVYPLAVESRSTDFPEADQRRRKWFSPAKAARKVQEPDLARIIRSFQPPPTGREADEQEAAGREADWREADGRETGSTEGEEGAGKASGSSADCDTCGLADGASDLISSRRQGGSGS